MSDPLGTGVQTDWTTRGPDMDRRWRQVSGPEAVAEAVIRRLITDRGSLLWAPEVGFDVRLLVNESVNTASRAPLIALETYVRAECLADDRVADADVTTTVDRNARTLSIAVSLVLSDDTAFRFVVRASELTAEILLAK